MVPRAVRRLLGSAVAVLGLGLGLGGCAEPLALPDRVAGPGGASVGPWRQQVHWIPMQAGDGTQVLLFGQVCRPTGDGPNRVVMINHGAPPNPSARPGMRLEACDSEAVRWFLTRGFVVVAAQRRGYGLTGGALAEAAFTGHETCEQANYARAGLESARDVEAVIAYATALPYARRDNAVVVGQSAGGFAAIALDSRPHPAVAAIVNMAGGRGGHHRDTPNNNCRPDRLAEAAGQFGASATTPMLWVYARNDSYFSPDIAEAMHTAFTRAGGRAELVQPARFGRDGHRLFFGTGGSAVWGPLIERYLARQLGSAGG